MSRRYWLHPFLTVLTMFGCADQPSTERDSPEPRVAATAGEVSILNPIAAEPVTGETGVLYFSLQNEGIEPDTLLQVTADLAMQTTMHNQVGAATGTVMEEVEFLVIPGRSLVSLRPGSYHVMLSELARHYREGDSLTITTRFSIGGEVTFRVPVVSYVDVAEHTQFRR